MRLSVVIATMLLATGALAQGASNDAVLKAIEALGQRLDGMQKEINELKKPQSPAQASQPAAAPSTGGAGQASPAPSARLAGRPVPGWRVEAVPAPMEGRLNEPGLFTFSAPASLIPYDQHVKTRDVSNWLFYRATAYFRAKQASSYTFSITQYTTSGYALCYRILSIDNNTIIKRTDAWNNNINNVEQIGNITLEAGIYELKMTYICKDFYKNQPGEIAITRIQIRTPDDAVPRDFRPDELFYLEKGRAEAPAPSSRNAAAGQSRSVVNSVNVRERPDVASGVATKLAPGQQITIAELVDNGAWAQIELSGRKIGYIRTSALELNTR